MSDSEFKELRDSVWARAAEGGLTSPQLLIALRLVEHWPNIFPGEKKLAAWTQLGESTVRASLRDLERARVIDVDRTPGRVNHYFFLGPKGERLRPGFPRLGPPVPRQELAHPPPGAGAPPARSQRGTPPGAGAEEDNLKTEPKKEVEAGGPRELYPHERAELRKLQEPSGGRPLGLYEFREGWKPKESHRARGQELGLTDAEMLSRAEECKLKLYERPFSTEDKQFMRELIWLSADKRGKANPHGRDENPGRNRRPGDPRPATPFGAIGAGVRRSAGGR